MLVARRVERDGSFYAGPFLPAHFARKTMSLTHRLFGIRSCNEVITGKRGRPCLEYDIKRCIAPCVDTICSRRGLRRAPSNVTQLFLEGQERRAAQDAAGRGCSTPPRASGSRRRRSCATRMRTVQTLHDRQQKMATAELGHRDVFGLKLGPAGVVVQVFQVRSGRVVERIELGTEAADRRRERRRRCSRRRSSSSTSCAARRRRSTCRPSPNEREALETLAVGARRPARAHRRAAARREARPRRSREPQRGARLPDALQPGDGRAVRRARDAAARARAAGAAAPHRVLRHLDDSGQRDRGVDGGLRRRPDAARRSIGSSGSGDWRPVAWTARSAAAGQVRERPGSRAPAPSPRPPSTTTSRRCTKSCCAAIASCSSRAGRFPI